MQLEKKDLVVLVKLQKVLELFGLKPDAIAQTHKDTLVIQAIIPQKGLCEVCFWFKLNKGQNRVTDWSLSNTIRRSNIDITRSETQRLSNPRRFFRKILESNLLLR